MKRLIIILSIVLFPMLAGAQAQINTKKVKISDFTQKVTKVVLTGNDFYDSMLEDEVKTHWRVTPYEFCTYEEFMAERNSSDYYFLLTTTGQFKRDDEPGLEILTLVKGGTGATINSMLEVVYLPFAASEDPSGRETIFMPAFLNIIQNHALRSMEKDAAGYIGLSNSVADLGRDASLQIVFSKDDLSSEITREFRDLNFDSDMMVTDEDSADDFMLESKPGTLVSYVVTTTDCKVGSYCYKMLINSETHELYYFRRHRITKKFGPGFLAEDIRNINSLRRR